MRSKDDIYGDYKEVNLYLTKKEAQEMARALLAQIEKMD